MTAQVLVTGAGGLLGSQVLRLAPADCVVTATYFQHPIQSDFVGDSHQIDLSDTLSVMRLFDGKKFDLVINCVGASDVDRCETDPAYALQTNVAVVQNLVEATSLYGARLITFSTDYVFDGGNGPYAETDTPNAVNFYGQTKLMSEELIKERNIDACVLRVCSLYSTDPQARRNLLKTMREVLLAGRVYRAADDLYSNPTEVADLAAAVWQLLSLPQLPRLLHLASPDNLSRFDLAKQVAERLSVDTQLVERQHLDQIGLAARRPGRAGLRSDRAYALLGRKLRSVAETI